MTEKPTARSEGSGHLTRLSAPCYNERMKEVTYTVHIEPVEEGGYFAYFPSLPGCFTQGETMDEVIAMAKEALIGFLEVLREHGQPIPSETIHSKRVGFEFPLSASLAR